MSSPFIKLKTHLKSAKRIVIASHVDPDCDTLGSALAMAHLLRQASKSSAQIVLYCASKIPDSIRFLPGSERFMTKLKGEFDLGVTFDCGNFARISPDGALRRQVKTLINVDHHVNNERYGDVNIILTAAATGEIVYNIAQSFGWAVSRDAATCLYAAIATDTGNFKYDSTTPETFEIAADLTRCGADPSRIAQLVYERKSLASLAVLGAALNRLHVGASGKLAWVDLPRKLMKKHGATSEDLNGLVEMIRSVDGVDVALLVRELNPKEVRINLRSKSTNIRPLAEKWGGGGHGKASGATVPGPLSKVLPRLVRDAEVFLKNSRG